MSSDAYVKIPWPVMFSDCFGRKLTGAELERWEEAIRRKIRNYSNALVCEAIEWAAANVDRGNTFKPPAMAEVINFVFTFMRSKDTATTSGWGGLGSPVEKARKLISDAGCAADWDRVWVVICGNVAEVPELGRSLREQECDELEQYAERTMNFNRSLVPFITQARGEIREIIDAGKQYPQGLRRVV